MKYFLIAGEASGDLHGANLMHRIKTLDAHAEFHFYGGDLMQAQGGTLLKHYSEMAFMGFVEVLANLQTINQNLADCKAAILKVQPDVLVLIDYPGFNLRIAAFAKDFASISDCKDNSSLIVFCASTTLCANSSDVKGTISTLLVLASTIICVISII